VVFRALETRTNILVLPQPRVLADLWFQVPDEVVEKGVLKNALKLVPGIDAKAFPE